MTLGRHLFSMGLHKTSTLDHTDPTVQTSNGSGIPGLKGWMNE